MGFSTRFTIVLKYPSNISCGVPPSTATLKDVLRALSRVDSKYMYLESADQDIGVSGASWKVSWTACPPPKGTA